MLDNGRMQNENENYKKTEYGREEFEIEENEREIVKYCSKVSTGILLFFWNQSPIYIIC